MYQGRYKGSQLLLLPTLRSSCLKILRLLKTERKEKSHSFAGPKCLSYLMNTKTQNHLQCVCIKATTVVPTLLSICYLDLVIVLFLMNILHQFSSGIISKQQVKTVQYVLPSLSFFLPTLQTCYKKR